VSIEICETFEEQIVEWVEGRNKHVVQGDQYVCCPDFSCCRPALTQPPEVRRAFQAADQELRSKFLIVFLGGLFANVLADVSGIYVVDGALPEEPS
jgi:hypothetical protein